MCYSSQEPKPEGDAAASTSDAPAPVSWGGKASFANVSKII